MEQRLHVRHPCYDEDAHHVFARMHVAVAPACNIHCNYCNRKFDCVSESRPGVVSKVLRPEEAVQKVMRTVQKLPHLTVVGIAGPGDPLANPEQTFAALEGIAREAPDLHLCLSTNGLMLEDYAARLAAAGVRHVTVTVNALDADIGSRIYDRVVWQGRIYRGREAAELLIARQLAGIQAVTAKGMACKINSVLIPGVNEDHLEEVSKVMKAAGAVSHNIMPLILSPGSRFEKAGQTIPEPALTTRVQERSARHLHVMRHCRQCRADAVGLLGDDLHDRIEELHGAGGNTSMEERETILQQLDDQVAAWRMKRGRSNASKLKGTGPQPNPAEAAIRIAVTSRGKGKINAHFGHARELLIYEVKQEKISFIGVRRLQPYCTGTAQCDEAAGKRLLLQEAIRMMKDCSFLLTSGIGRAPEEAMQQAGITPLVRKGDIMEALLECARYHDYFNSGYLSPIS